MPLLAVYARGLHRDEHMETHRNGGNKASLNGMKAANDNPQACLFVEEGP